MPGMSFSFFHFFFLQKVVLMNRQTPLAADLVLFCYERDFMTSLSDVKQAEIIEAFKSTSRYLDDLFIY